MNGRDGMDISDKQDLEIGDLIRMKKKHPCGSDWFRILRTGADFRLECTGCSHQVMLSRRAVEKNVKAVKKA